MLWNLDFDKGKCTQNSVYELFIMYVGNEKKNKCERESQFKVVTHNQNQNLNQMSCFRNRFNLLWKWLCFVLFQFSDAIRNNERRKLKIFPWAKMRNCRIIFFFSLTKLFPFATYICMPKVCTEHTPCI